MRDATKDKIHTVIPVQPGYFVVSPIHEENGEIIGVSRDHVVAWVFYELGYIHPITLQGGLEDRGDPPILCPDGVVSACSQEWLNLDAWFEDVREAGSKA